MKVAPIHRAFLAYAGAFTHDIVHTGQHYDARMSDAFFSDLDMPQPTWFLGVGSGSHAEQTAKVMTGFDDVLTKANPDYVIVVGDVNSTIACALTSVKRGIRTAHVEAGLRSFDRSMPEEINRLATDAICDDLFVTEDSAVRHLLSEGHSASSIHFVGNTMIDSLLWALPASESSTILSDVGVQEKSYVLVTLHRPSNVDHRDQLAMLLGVLAEISKSCDVVFPIHPRTRKHIMDWNLAQNLPQNLRLIEPVGYVDFLALMNNAQLVLTDSGGIQEETTALGVPCVTARTTTERPVTVEQGTNVLVQPTAAEIRSAVQQILDGNGKHGSRPDLWDGRASDRIAAIIADKLSE